MIHDLAVHQFYWIHVYHSIPYPEESCTGTARYNSHHAIT